MGDNPVRRYYYRNEEVPRRYCPYRNRPEDLPPPLSLHMCSTECYVNAEPEKEEDMEHNPFKCVSLACLECQELVRNAQDVEPPPRISEEPKFVPTHTFRDIKLTLRNYTGKGREYATLECEKGYVYTIPVIILEEVTPSLPAPEAGKPYRHKKLGYYILICAGEYAHDEHVFYGHNSDGTLMVSIHTPEDLEFFWNNFEEVVND